MLEPLCPICTHPARYWQTIRDHKLWDCANCGHRFAIAPQPDSHVDVVYGDHYFTGGGAGYTNYAEQSELLRKRGHYYASIADAFVPARGAETRRLVDVGAAAGFLLRGWIDKGWTGWGVEPNPSMVALAAEQSLDVRREAFESMAIAEAGQIDCVAMVQVLPHFVEPMRALRQAWTLLRPGGILLIEAWDRDSRIARVLGPRWHEYSPPSVLNWFTRESLSYATAQIGFEFETHRRVVRWIDAGHAKSLLAHSNQGKGALIRLVNGVASLMPNRLKIPYPGDDLFYAVYRKPAR
ncbi:MAG: class I SAM-dependent methyltransferase [Burkholderiales bacterium]|nr:MAG: class I SAM-dependent methyltransferase [Burkholderiales bacterium]